MVSKLGSIPERKQKRKTNPKRKGDRLRIKKNCWEFKKCARGPGGSKLSEFGTCPAATDISSDGINGGRGGGRVCWAVTGTLCSGEVQGTFTEKITTCMSCDFFQQVKKEEGAAFALQPSLLLVKI
jgi:hypothetical protein